MDIITNIAELACNQSTTKSKLTITSQDFVTIEDKPVATEGDKQASEYNDFRSVQVKAYYRRLFALYTCTYKLGANR